MNSKADVIVRPGGHRPSRSGPVPRWAGAWWPVPWLLVCLWLLGCSDDGNGTLDATVDAEGGADVGDTLADGRAPDAGPVLPPYLAEICAGRSPDETAEATTMTWAGSEPVGVLQGLEEGDVEAIGFLAVHPLRFSRVRLYLIGSGTVTVHVWDDWFRSEPNLDADLVPPKDVTVSGEGWYEYEFDPVLRDPSQRFWVGIVHGSGTAQLVLAPGRSVWSRFKSPALIDPPFVWSGIGGDVEYMVQVEGQFFCKRQSTWFSDRTAQVGLDRAVGGRAAVADVDGDGIEDVTFHLNQGSERPNVWLFDGAVFQDASSVAFPEATHSNFVVYGDLDNDGDQDAYLGVYTPQDGEPHPGESSIWLNDGSGRFSKVVGSGVAVPATTAAGAFADYDRDGFLDLYVGNWLVEYPYPEAMDDYLFKGLGDGTFQDVSETAGIRLLPSPCYGVTWCDVNDDGLPDILVANYGYARNYLFLNQGDGTFQDVGRPTNVAMDDVGGRGGNTFGIDCGDYDNDGDLDLFLAEIAHPRYQPWSDPSRLLQQRSSVGEPGFFFADVTADANIPYDEGMIDPSWVDYDNDGDLDLFVSVLYKGHSSRLFRNNGDGTFTDVTYLAGIDVPDGQAGVWADFDGDGDMDLVATDRRGGGRVHYYENRAAEGTVWVELRLVGRLPSNRDAIGARVWAETPSQTQVREVKGGKGHNNTASSRVVHFGFGTRTERLTIRVRWPSGLVETFDQVPYDQLTVLREGTGRR